MTDFINLLKETKKLTRSVLLPNVTGLSLDVFEKEYCGIIGECFPYQRLGFVTTLDLLKSMAEVVHVKTLPSGHLQLFSVPEPSTEHLSHMVISQKGPQKQIEDECDKKTPHVLKQEKHQSPSSIKHSEAIHTLISEKMTNNLHAIISKHTDGLPASQLCREYKKQHGHELNPNNLGCPSIVELCMLLPKIFTVIRGGIDGKSDDWVLYSSDKISEGKTAADSGYSGGQNHNGSNSCTTSDKLPEFTKKSITTSNSIATGVSGCESNASQNSIPECIVSNIKRVLMRNSQGLNYQKFLRAYLETPGENLDVNQLGFFSLETLLKSLCARKILQLSRQDSIIMITPTQNEFYGYEHIPRWRDEKHGKVNSVLGPCDEVPPQKLSSNIKLGDFLDVIVAEVFNPNRFWIQLKGEYTSKALESLMEDMEVFYGDSAAQFKIPDASVVVGLVCVGLFKDGCWYRCFVTSMKDLTTVEVLYIDYGNVLRVKKDTLLYLHRKFSNLSGQAIQARLAGIKPFGGLRRFTKESSERFVELVGMSPETMGHVAVVRGMGERLALWLVDTCSNDLPQGVAINQVLVDEKLAEPDMTEDKQEGPVVNKKMGIKHMLPLRQPNLGEVTVAKTEETLKQLETLRMWTDNSSEGKKPQVLIPVYLDGHASHIVNKEGSAWMTSHQISCFIPNWKGRNLLPRMLTLKSMHVPSLTVTPISDLHSSLKLVINAENSEEIILYSLTSVPHILNMFLQVPGTQLREDLQFQIENFSPN